MNNNDFYVKRKKRSEQFKKNIVLTTYDKSIGVIRIIDNSVDSNAPTSVSPLKLNRALRRNIKKPLIAKNV